MKCVAVCLLLLVAAHAAQGGMLAFQTAHNVAQLIHHVSEQVHHVTEKAGVAHLQGLKADACTIPSSYSVSLDTLLAQSSAKAACKAAKFSAYDSAQASLNLTRVETNTTASICDSAGKSAKQYAKQPYTCAITVSYSPASAKDTFKAAVTGNAQPGHVIAVDSNVHIVMSMTISLLGVSNSSLTDETDTFTGELAAMANACDKTDAQALVTAISAYMDQMVGVLNQAIGCYKVAIALFGGSLDVSIAVTMSQTLYTEVDGTTYQPVDSSKVTGQGSLKGAAAGLAAPAHVWLLTAAAVAAIFFGKLH